MHDVDTLLRPISEEAPSGPDLEYDPDFSALMLAAQPGEERQVGDAVIEAEEPDWSDVLRKCGDVLERTHDLRAGIVMANAALKREGLAGFAAAMQYLRGCVETHWDTCHPQLDAEDDDDPTMRVNAMLALTDEAGLMRALRLAALTESRMFGRITLRDVEVSTGEIPQPSDMEKVPDATEISAAFKDTGNERVLELREAALAALEHTRAIAAIFDDKVGALGPDLDKAIKRCQAIFALIDRHADVPAEAAAEVEVTGEDGTTTVTMVAAAPAPPPGTISSREDVDEALGKIIDYYAEHEPSSPVPLIINRARRLVAADFMTILKDVAPRAVSDFTEISGAKDDDD
ncbi:MAG: type VI secretion system protein TssA [Pseudomonadota bacterium]